MKHERSLARLSEHELLDRFSDLIRRDRHNTAHLLATIAKIDKRKLWAKLACPSMFAFCVERFHMSESVTAKRIWAARTARRFPVILRMVARGELTLSAIQLLSKHLTEENHRAVLARAKHMTTREVERLVAELAPKPDVPSRIRALPRTSKTDPAVRLDPAAVHVARDRGAATTGRDATDDGAAQPMSTTGRSRQVAPLSPRRYKLEVTVDQQTHDKLRILQDLLSHGAPNADPATIMSKAIDRLLDETLKRKAGARNGTQQDDRRACSSRGRRRTRAIPAAIRREVWRRDEGRCTFVDSTGRRCRGTRAIEYHHRTPYARGGKHEEGNIELRCRAHNQYEADLDFGRDFMRRSRGLGAEDSARNVLAAADIPAKPSSTARPRRGYLTT